MPAKPYQILGMDFLTARKRAFLCDDAGLGKSMQIINAANQIGADRLLILAPAVARGSWKLQLEEWDGTNRPVLTYPLKSKKDKLPKGRLALVVGIEYLSSKTRAQALMVDIAASEPFNAAAVDEAQMVKSPDAARTKSIYGPRLDLKNAVLSPDYVNGPRWLATATPTPLGHVGELYAHLRALFPDVLAKLFGGTIPTKFGFEDRFCHVWESRFGREIMGNNPETVAELRAALAPHIIMRRKADVLTELPPIITIPLPLETGFKLPDTLTEEQVAAMTDADVEAYLRELTLLEGSPRRHLGNAKAAAALPWIKTFLDDDQTRKILVFGHHREVIAALFEGLEKYGPVVLDGSKTPAQKEEAVQRFQTMPSHRVFIGQNKSAGTAITLTAASTVLLVEPDPSPDQNYQIVSRAHRIGQKDTVTAYVAYDEAVPLERRQAQILRRRAEDNYEMFGVKTPGVLA